MGSCNAMTEHIKNNKCPFTNNVMAVFVSHEDIISLFWLKGVVKLNKPKINFPKQFTK